MKSQDYVNNERKGYSVTTRCPICKRSMETARQGPPSGGRFFPFCSARCKLIDLGAWFDAEYRIPGPEDEAVEEE